MGKNQQTPAALISDESKVKEFTTLKEKIISALLREDMFLPFGLDLLNYDIIWTKDIWMGAPAATDYMRIYVNLDHQVYETQFKSGITVQQSLTHDILHEDMHILFEHKKRRENRDPSIWNVACDFMIEGFLKNLEGEFRSHNTGSDFITMNLKNWPTSVLLISDKFNNMLEEEIYDYLLSSKAKFTKKVTSKPLKSVLQQCGCVGNGDGEEDDGSSGPQVTMTEVKFEVDGKKFQQTYVEFPPMKQMFGEEAEKKAKDRIKLTGQMLQNNLSKGNISASFQKFLDKLFNVKIDYTKVLRDSILTALEKSHELTWGKPRMSWLANPLELPYMPSCDEEEKYGVAVFAIDESGSMGDDDIRKAAKVIVDLKDHYKGVLVMKHDTVVAWQEFYDDPDDIPVNKLLTRKTCGGTSHSDVFKRVQKFTKDHPDDMVSIFIACTDMCSDIIDTQNLMDSSIPRIYIVNCDYHRGLQGLLGRVIPIT